MITEKEYVFYLHYNNSESNKKKKPQITVHHKGIKYIVDNISCDCVIFSAVNNYEPRCILKGKTDNFHINNNVAHMSSTHYIVSSGVGYKVEFFYNKPESNRVGKTQITIIYRGKNYNVDNIICNVPIHSVTKKMEFTLNGRCQSLKIEKGIAYLD